ncbi:MAG: hypothetical protein ACOY9D_12355 [Pseudomonadota bacterium]
MSSKLTISKLDAAVRQLDAAIRLFFSGADPIVVHTLAASAGNIFADVAEHRYRGVSWRTRMRDDAGLSTQRFKNILHDAWNFFKHANHDPDGVLQFEEVDSEHLMFVAVLDCGDIQATSCNMQAFQLWYIATHPEHFPETDPVFANAINAFSDLAALPLSSRIQHGNAFLVQHCGNGGAET